MGLVQVLPGWEPGSKEREDALQGFGGRVSYLTRSMDGGKYKAHLFLAAFSDIKSLESGWEPLNQAIAADVQSEIASLIERSNFYICCFVPGKVSESIRATIENNTYCAKKYVFDENALDQDDIKNCYRAEKRIFALDSLIVPKQEYIQHLCVLKMQNFRAFEGTLRFNFVSSRTGKPASFVAIYAPNGMGKTSLCDAMEWCLTGNVHRLNELIKKIGEDVGRQQGCILRNRTAGKDCDAYVEMEWENHQCVHRKVQKSRTETGYDLNLGSLNKSGHSLLDQNGRWDQILMPHDKIENFIGAKKPVDQFKEWMDCADSDNSLRLAFQEAYQLKHEADNAYSKAEENWQMTRDEITELAQGQGDAQELLENLKAYNQVAPQEEKLDFPRDGLEVKWYDKLITNAATQSENIRQGMQNTLLHINEASALLQDQTNTLSQLLKKFKEANQEVKNCNERVAQRKSLNHLETSLAVLIENLRQKGVENTNLAFIEQQGEERFRQIMKQYDKVLLDLPTLPERIKNLDTELLKTESLLSQNVTREQQLIAEQNSHDSYKCLLELAKRVEMLMKDRTDTDVEIIRLKKDIKQAKKEQVQVEQNLRKCKVFCLPEHLEQFVQAAPEDWSGAISDEAWKKLKNLCTEYRAAQNQFHIYQLALQKAENDSDELKTLKENGQNYIVAKQSLTQCPLCHTPFDSWEKLYSATLRLQETQSDSLAREGTLIQEKFIGLGQRYHELYTSWKLEYPEKVKAQTTVLCNVEKAVQEKTQALIKFQSALENIESNIDVCKETALQKGWKTERLTISDVEIYEAERQKKLKAEINTREADCKRLSAKKEKDVATKTTLLQEQQQLEETKRLISITPALLDGIQYLKKQPDDFNLELRKQTVEKEQYDLQLRVSEQKLKQEELQDVKLLTMEQCLEDLRVSQQHQILLQKEYDKICRLLGDAPFTDDSLRNCIDKWKKLAEVLTKRQMLLDRVCNSGGARDYFKKYRALEEKFKILKQDKVTKETARKIAQVAFVKEKQRLSEQLKDYFGQDLFNDIYQKIEPHKQMKNVDYRPDYNDNGKPELYIEVKQTVDGKDGDIYQPEWFFSTAQLNTVALSSFLGRAISANDLPLSTVLIDDPVGHFDDMNILGFADLVRSIIEKTDKQIIITTHDETVFQIFRRKLSEDKYNSKFIRLENYDDFRV